MTGDGRGASVRPGVTQVFDLDGTRLAALAAGMGLPVAVPESPEAPPVGLRPGPGGREAARRRAALRAQPREQPGAGRRVRRRRPGRRRDAAVRRRGRRLHRRARRPGCCSASPACTWTTRSSSACWPRRTRGRRASRPPSRRRGRCSRSPAWSGVNLSGSGSSRGEDDGAQVKAEVAATAERDGMTELESEAMEAEFDTVAGWTEEAVRALGPEYAVPAGCRGSGSEGALRWLADRLGLGPGTRLLDAGAGVGGPAGWLAAERGVRPVCAEPMAAGRARRAGGCSACRRWSPWRSSCRSPTAPSTRPGASASSAPRRTRPGALAELRRVLRPRRPAGPAGLRRRRPAAPAAARGQRVPVGAGAARPAATTPASRSRSPRDADLGDSPRGVDRAGRRRGRRGGAAARRRSRVRAGAGERPPGRPAALRRRAPGLAGGRDRHADAEMQRNPCKEIFALLWFRRARRRDPAGTRRPGHRRPRAARARPPAAQPAARAAPAERAGHRQPARPGGRGEQRLDQLPPAPARRRTASSRRSRGRAPRGSAGGAPGTG